MEKTAKEKASRDLFGVALDLDLVLFKLDNIAEDLQEEKKHYSAERLEIVALASMIKTAQKQAEALRIRWDHENKI